MLVLIWLIGIPLSKENCFEKPMFDMFDAEGKIQFDAQKIGMCRIYLDS